jgi:SAM-dependent methyltransferase
MISSDPARFYLDGEYASLNPSWDSDDSTWKAALVADLLERHALQPRTLVDVGCGAGAVLAALRSRLPDCTLHGWDIAPGAARFWPAHPGIAFTQGDFLNDNRQAFDVLLLLDVVEHVANPHDFLARVAPSARHVVLHFPLDLSVASVLRESPLLQQRRQVGHIHYFTRNLAIALLAECGYEIVDARFSGAHLRPRGTTTGKLASLARRAVFALDREVGVRLLGGDTLIVLARSPAGSGGRVDDPRKGSSP